MRLKINRILIPILLSGLFCFSIYLPGTALNQANPIFLPIITSDQSHWIGPSGGYITVLAVNPTNSLEVYAGTWGSGVYKSTDDGQTWQPASSGIDNLYINSLAIDPSQPSTLYAGTYRSQVYKSTDGGSTWSWSGIGMQDQAIVYTIAIDPVVPTTLYAGTRGVSNNGSAPWNGVVYKSIDAGLSWIPVLKDVGGVLEQDWVYSLAINPNYHFQVYAATHEHGPYHSYKSGEDKTWNPIDGGIKDYSGRSIVVFPDSKDPTILYYGVWHFDTLYKSLVGGNDWFPVNHDNLYTKVNSIALSPKDADIVYLATANKGVQKSTNGGDTWSPAGLYMDKVDTLVVDPASPTGLLAGTAGDGVYHSFDAGITWKHRDGGIQNSMATSVVTSPSDPGALYTSSFGAGVMRSIDMGAAWLEVNSGLGDKFVHALVRDPAHPELLYALTDTGGLYQKNLLDDLGWRAIGMGLPLTAQPALAYPPGHPFASYGSEEAAVSGEKSTNQLASDSLLVMAYAPSDSHIAYLGTGSSGVYKSMDGGLTWQQSGLAGEIILSLAVDSSNPDLVYASAGIAGSLKISNDGGITWGNSSLSQAVYTLTAVPGVPGDFYAGTSSGLFRYQAGSWVLVGLPGYSVTAIDVDPSHPGTLLAGTTSGAYYTVDAGLTWKSVSARLTNITIQSIHIDPAHPNWIYFSTKTHGIYLATLPY